MQNFNKLIKYAFEPDVQKVNYEKQTSFGSTKEEFVIKDEIKESKFVKLIKDSFKCAFIQSLILGFIASIIYLISFINSIYNYVERNTYHLENHCPNCEKITYSDNIGRNFNNKTKIFELQSYCKECGNYVIKIVKSVNYNYKGFPWPFTNYKVIKTVKDPKTGRIISQTQE